MSAEELKRAILTEDEIHIMDESDLNQTIEEEEKALVTDILLTELDTANHINLDTNNQSTVKEVQSISKDILDILGI